MTSDKMREFAEKLVLTTYDNVIQFMDDKDKPVLTRSEVMSMKLNFQKRMDLR